MMEKLKKLLSSVWSLYRDAQYYRTLKDRMNREKTIVKDWDGRYWMNIQTSNDLDNTMKDYVNG